MYDHPYQNYFYNVEQRLRKLEQENRRLKKRISQLKPINIENINYKIQELVVRELKGTLNIGMTALTDPEEIKKWLQEADGVDIELDDVEQSDSEQT